jgi:hypothetical protein
LLGVLSQECTMTQPNPDPQSSASNTPAGSTPPSVLRCISGSVVAGGIAMGSYFLTASIAQTFANKPITSDNITVLNITVAVRTLVIGISALGTGIFALASLGLMALGIQLLIQQFNKQSEPPSDISS